MEVKTIHWFERDHLCAVITYTGAWPNAQLLSYTPTTDDVVDLPFPVHRASSDALNYLFTDRLAPKENFCKAAAKYYGVEKYDAELMCRARHAAMPPDTFWMKFENDPEDLCWDDVTMQ